MPLLTHYRSFFISPFGEASVTDELNKFLQANRIINVEKRLIDGERGTGWIFLVEFSSDKKTPADTPSRIDYKEVLTGQEFAVFEKIRTLRKELADKLALPVYAVCTNEQLAAMVKSMPASLSELGKIPGIGEAKLKQFGRQFVDLLNTLKIAKPAPEDTVEPPPDKPKEPPDETGKLSF
jgi:superfamily II DNA helicase RecQ